MHRAAPNTNRRAVWTLIAMCMGFLIMLVAFLNSPANASTKPIVPWVGAHTVTNDPSIWAAGNSQIGPLHTQRIFYSTLPASYTDDNYCSGLPAGVLCLVSWTTLNTNVVSYVRSIPADRQVIMLFTHEPENAKFASGADFVKKFISQSVLVRSVGHKNVQVATASASYLYVPGAVGANCSYIPPATAVDHYLVDTYDPTGTLLKDDAGFAGWRHCTANRKRSRGFAEWGVGPSSCIKSGLSRTDVMKQDLAWLPKVMPTMYLLEYWWVDNSGTTGLPCKDWQFSTSEASAWHSAVHN